MAGPNPIMIPRMHAEPQPRPRGTNSQALGRSAPLFVALLGVQIAATFTLSWARRWTLSGAATESFLLFYGFSTACQILPDIPIWALLGVLNSVYAVCSTSWLLYGVFTAVCYPAILLTCLFQFPMVSNFARRRLRRLLRELHFTRDTIALFNLPALEIDTDVHGLFVVRGVSISLSSLTIVAHGLELGIKLSEDMELALYVDEVTIQLFRRITIGQVYGNVKGGIAEMTFADLDIIDAEDDSVFQIDTSLLRAAGRSATLKPARPAISRGFTGGSYIKDSSVRESLDTMTKLSPDDTAAERQYNQMIKHIEVTSHVYEAQKQVSASDTFSLDKERDTQAAVCAKLQDMPSVPHPPSRSVRVTTLQNLTPPSVREFLHRLPFLLRLLLMPLSYFHPITISSIAAAGSGKYLTGLLQEHIFKHYSSQNAQIRRLERKVLTWLASANFSASLSDISALGQVPLSSEYDIHTYLRIADVAVYRTVAEAGSVEEVARLGGADATFTIPSFLLPHHEHLLPSKPTAPALEQQVEAAEEADGKPKTVQAEHELEKMKADETEVNLSVHASLPACFDQSLLNFVAALVKATKIIELEKTVDETVQSDDDELPGTPTSIMSMSTESLDQIPPPSRTGTGFKNFASGIRQTIKDGKAGDSIKELARDLHQSTKKGMKMAVGGMANDRWIAKIVGKVAATLEQTQGDLGYSGGIPVPLAPYRPSEELPSKLLP